MATPKKAARKKAAPEKAPASKDEAGAFMAVLDHPLKADIEIVRKLILGVSQAISDGVKWNSLSFRHTDWFATVNLRSKDVVQLVFHTGAKAKDNPELKIPDSNGLLLWLAKDRALATLGSGRTLKANARAFEAIVKAWIRYV
jgi:hypothetical protein